MKTFITTLLLAVMSTVAMAQNNNLVISSIHVYDNEDGTGTVEVRVAGGEANTPIFGTVSVSGDRILGGAMTTGSTTTTRCGECSTFPGNTQIVSFPVVLMSPELGDDFVEVNVNINAAIILRSKSKLGRRPKKYY